MMFNGHWYQLPQAKRRLSVIMLHASMRKIDMDIIEAQRDGDKKRIDQLIAQRHSVSHQACKLAFKEKVQARA